jgi:hypothetical protein
MARTFNGTSDKWEGTIGACNIAPPLTMVAILRHVADGRYDTFMAFNADATTTRYSMDLDNDTLEFDCGGGGAYAAFTVKTAEGWVLVAGSKATGTATPRAHKYVYGTNAWTHSNFDRTLTDGSTPGAGGLVRLGGDSAFDGFFGGDLTLAALFNRVLTDAEVENLPFSLAAILAMAPVGLWLLDQSLTTQKVLDWTGGGANENALTGTSIASSSVPILGYGHPQSYLRPQAAAAATLFRRGAGLRPGSRSPLGGR